jgi:circadian clock protein KaiB
MSSKQGRARRTPSQDPGGAKVSVAEAGPAKQTEGDPEYVLRLFVSGLPPRSQRAIDNLRRVCDRFLAGRHRIEVIDLRDSPGSANDEQIVATPTLLKVLPFPPRRIIGDLSQVDKLLHGLDIG